MILNYIIPLEYPFKVIWRVGLMAILHVIHVSALCLVSDDYHHIRSWLRYLERLSFVSQHFV